MKIILIIIALAAVSAQADPWLSPAKSARLNTVANRPYVTAVTTKDQTSIYHWTDGKREWSTTQTVQTVLGKPAKNAWRDKLDAHEKEKSEILAEVSAIASKSGTVKKSDLTAIVEKHAARKAR